MRDAAMALQSLVRAPWKAAHPSWLEPASLKPGWPALSSCLASEGVHLGRWWAWHFKLPIPDRSHLESRLAWLEALPAAALDCDSMARAAGAIGRVIVASRPGFLAAWPGRSRMSAQHGTAGDWREACRMARARALNLPGLETAADESLPPDRLGMWAIRRVLADEAVDLWPWLRFRLERGAQEELPEPGEPGSGRQPALTAAIRRQIVGLWCRSVPGRRVPASVESKGGPG